MPARSRQPEPEETPESPPPTLDALKAFIDVFHEDWQALPLAAKLAKIAGTLGNIPKRGWNPNQRYKFAQETDLVAAIRPYLSAAGILITFSQTDHEILARQNPDAKGLLTRVRLHWTVTDGKESIEGDMDGYGMDAGDKGIYKAITGAKKYTLMTLFLVDTGDDPEADTKTDVLTHGQPDRVRSEEPPAAVVGPLKRSDVVRGGHTTEATDVQRARLVEAVRIQNWSARQFLSFIRTELGSALLDAPEDDPTRLRSYLNELLNGLSPVDMGRLLMAVEQVVAPDEVPYG